METIVKKLEKNISIAIDIPGDKSISHRSVIFGSIIPGETVIKNFLQGEDCKHTLEAFQAMGVKSELSNDTLIIYGKKLSELTKPNKEIYLGNSGTSIRLLSGLFSGLAFTTILTGDESLQKRPMNRVIDPLKTMGAEIDSKNGGLAPLIINPKANNTALKAIHYNSPIASAQVKSCLMLAALSAEGETIITEPHLSRDHTERMLNYLGAEINQSNEEIKINGREAYSKLQAKDIFVPGDISSAAFFMVAAAILNKAEITVKNVGLNPSRIGILEAFDLMHVDYEILNQKEVNNEPIADIKVRSSKIKAAEIGGALIPKLIDEIPIISILAAQAEGKTVIKDAEELRVKESNRIASTLNMLKKLGVEAQETADGMIINGRNRKPFEVENLTEIDSYGDHRLAMSSTIAGLYANNPIEILKTEFVQTSFPNFFELVNQLYKANDN
jgi:3-phosphoshikimate 1-carboxyvinyltransferase